MTPAKDAEETKPIEPDTEQPRLKAIERAGGKPPSDGKPDEGMWAEQLTTENDGGGEG